MRKKLKALVLVMCLAIFAVIAVGSGEVKAQGQSEVTIDEQVIYDADGIKITAKGLEEDWMGTALKLLIENNSDKSVTIQGRNSSVNGFMVDTIMSADVAAGKKANESLIFETTGLKDCGIEKIASMEFNFTVFDPETWDTILDTDVISIDTSIASSYTQSVDDSGDVLVDESGVKIIAKGLSSEDSVWGPGVKLYIENNTDKNITVQVRDVSVNGCMVDSIMSEDLVAGKKAISVLQFFGTDLEDNSITDITDVELFFQVFDQESWDTIFDSDVVQMKF